jgi:MiaB-like tRNA modifying enzyme
MGIETIREKRVYIETYGCTYNSGDTEKLARVLLHQACTIEDSADCADIVVINTCTVIAPTERRMLKVLRKYRDREIFVTGCMPLVQEKKIREICSSRIITPSEIYTAFRALRKPKGRMSGVVQIAQGCLGHCTYCITRKARGSLVSFPQDEILSQIEECGRARIPEIQLTAQDVSAWGRDIGKSLPELLGAISDMEGNFLIRLGMMNPATMKPILPDLLDAFSNENVFRFIHVPVQSGSDRILTKMGRDYSADDFIAITEAFRSRYPDITLMTDIIVGFPGETGEDFEHTLTLARRTTPHKVNVTRFSRREMTDMEYEKEFPDSVKKDRSRILLSCAERGYHLNNAAWIGKTVPFIVTEQRKPGSVISRTPNYLNVVLPGDLPPGYRGLARIREDKTYYFTGDLLDIQSDSEFASDTRT